MSDQDPAASELRVALFALFSAVGEWQPEICSTTVDLAVKRSFDADADLASGGVEPIAARFGAARLLNSLCGACRGCSRGATGETPAITLQPQGEI